MNKRSALIESQSPDGDKIAVIVVDGEFAKLKIKDHGMSDFAASLPSWSLSPIAMQNNIIIIYRRQVETGW